MEECVSTRTINFAFVIGSRKRDNSRSLRRRKQQRLTNKACSQHQGCHRRPSLSLSPPPPPPPPCPCSMSKDEAPTKKNDSGGERCPALTVTVIMIFQKCQQSMPVLYCHTHARTVREGKILARQNHSENSSKTSFLSFGEPRL